MADKRRPGRALNPLVGSWVPGSYSEHERIRGEIPYFHGLWRRAVPGGQLRAILTRDQPGGWHLSVSFAPTRTDGKWRYPTWDELADARYELASTKVEFVMYLPKPDDFVNLHDTCFHLHEYPPDGFRLVELEP